jgi:polyribonucleotide nucleotidyltransferase
MFKEYEISFFVKNYILVRHVPNWKSENWLKRLENGKAFWIGFAKGKIIKICTIFRNKLNNVVFQDGKSELENAITAIKEEIKAVIIKKLEESGFCEISLNMTFEELQKKWYRNTILDNDRRVDSRSLTELHSIDCSMDVLPVVHGSAAFQSEKTQVLVSLTLGCSNGFQETDAITGGIQSKSFLAL